MALFGTKKNKEVKDEKTSVEKVAKPTTKKAPAKKPAAKSSSIKATPANRNLANVLVRPRITEKAAILASDNNCYVFDVSTDTTKSEVKAAVEQIYKVSPIKIAIVKVPNKKVRVRGQRRKAGIKTGGKKAYIFLKKGDRIEFV